jgi:Oligosaccharyl transferase STT3, N-terminal
MNRRKTASVVGLVILGLMVLGLAICLRMIPSIGTKVVFTFDAAFNYRMTADLVQTGHVPGVDRLSTYPLGKRIGAFIPTGMYYACAAFHNFINKFTTVPLPLSILYFCSISGALICVPVYFLSFHLYRSKLVACSSAALSALVPAFVQRSSCYWYRYEAIGTPMLFTSLLFFSMAVSAESNSKRVLHSLLCTSLLVLSFYVWRLSVLFAIGYLVYFAYLCLWERSAFRKKWAVLVVISVGLAASLPFLPGFGNPTSASQYGSFPVAAWEIWKAKLGLQHGFREFTRLVLDNQELASSSLPDLFGWESLSFSGVLLIFYFFSVLKKGSREPSRGVLPVFVILFLVLTFVTERNKAVLGPLTALTLGEALIFARRRKGVLRNLLLGTIILALLGTGYDSYHLMQTRSVNTRLDPGLRKALIAIQDMTPVNAVLVCYWADGYPIQTYTRRATTTDGLFESPEIVKRIIRESKAYYSYDEDDLWNLCREYGATHLLVPFRRKQSYSRYAGVDYDKYFPGMSVTREGELTTLYRLLGAPNRLRRFSRLYENNEYVLYQVRP